MYKSGKGPGRPKKTAEARSVLAARFRVLLLDAGLKVPEAAKFFQVTERTVYAWISGQTTVPYSAYRLLRLVHCFELPGSGWEGWSMHSGKLWTPEGFAFEPVDGAWWSLLVRQARSFRLAYAQMCKAEREAAVLRQVAAEGPRLRGGAAANLPKFEPSPMVITGITHGDEASA